MKKFVGQDVSELFRDCPDCHLESWDNLCPRCDGSGAVPACPTCGRLDAEVVSSSDYRDGGHVFYFSCRCGTSTVVKVNAVGSIVSVDTKDMVQLIGPMGIKTPMCRECGEDLALDFYGQSDGCRNPECRAYYSTEPSAQVEAPMCPKHGLAKIPGEFYGPKLPDWVCPECRSEKAFKQDLVASAARVKSQLPSPPAPEPAPLVLSREVPDVAEVPPEVLKRFRNLHKL